MGITIKIAFLISLLVNLLIFSLGSIWVYQKGGIPYLIRKIAFLKISGSRLIPMYDTPFYWDKKSHFDTLSNSDSEIVFLGDSLTDLCEWHEFFRSFEIKNRGICGDTTEGILNRLDEIVESKPNKLFLLIGINDINQGRTVEDIFNSYKQILERVKNKTPETKIFVQSILPVNSQKFPNHAVNEKIVQLNARLRLLANDFLLQYIDLFSSFLDSNHELDEQYTTDGIHLNGSGYLRWKEIIEKNVVS